jgi:sulfite exporter TauE/SafE
VFTTFLLFSILANIYLVKRNEGNIINGNSNRVADLPESIYGACGLMGMLACSIVLKFLSPDGKNLLGEMTAGILACLAQYVAIRTFYKHIIRMRYKIDEVLNQQKQKPKKKR